MDKIYSVSDLEEILHLENCLRKRLVEEEKVSSKAPKTTTINNILAYSKALSVKKTKQAGVFLQIMN